MAIMLTAPQNIPTSINMPVIFLAGSIEMDKAENWQQRLFQSLHGINSLLLNPRRERWDSSWSQSIENSHFRAQVEWELDGLDRADIIVVYFDPNTKSPITLLEVGLHASSGKMLVCCPDGFWRKGNIEIVCDRYNIPLLNTFDALIESLTSKLNQEK